MTDTKDPCRAAFEGITESLYEGDFAQYVSGDYVNQVQQYQWEGFHDGWKSHAKHQAELLEALDYLLQQTVDQDLKHGITLTEGEEDARQRALAVIAKVAA